MSCERHEKEGTIILSDGRMRCYGCYCEQFDYCPLCGYKWDDPRECKVGETPEEMNMVDRLLTSEEIKTIILKHCSPETRLSDVFPEPWLDEIVKAQDAKALKAVEGAGVKIHLASCADKPIIEFGDGDFVEQIGALTEFLMHLSILMPNSDLPDDLIIIPTKALRGKFQGLA